MHSRTFGSLLLSALLLTGVIALNAQAPGPAGRGGRGPVVVSPQVLPDRRVIVRLYAPQAKQVTVTGIVTPAVNLSKQSDEGVWEATLGPVDPGAYRYGFQVDGTSVIDPRNIDMERMQVQVRSILYVPGAAFNGYQRCASRRGGAGELLLEGAWEVPAHACLYAARL